MWFSRAVGKRDVDVDESSRLSYMALLTLTRRGAPDRAGARPYQHQ